MYLRRMLDEILTPEERAVVARGILGVEVFSVAFFSFGKRR